MTTLAVDPRPAGGSRTPATGLSVLGAGAAIAAERVPAGRGRRSVARPDEDAITLAVEAAGRALGDNAGVRAIILVGTTLPYAEGGSVQALAELLGLQGDVLGIELSASPRDALVAVRLAQGLAAPGGHVLLCAAHADREDPTTGDGATALLLAEGVGAASLAELRPAASLTVELRDRWRLRGHADLHEADRSFAAAVGTGRLSTELLAAVPDALRAPAAVVGSDRRASASAEAASGGPGDALAQSAGIVGAAHPLLRLLDATPSGLLVAAVANGLGEALHVTATERGVAAFAEVVARCAADAVEVDRPTSVPPAEDFDPFASAPRSWRERDRDLRLRGLVGGPDGLVPVPGRSAPTGTVIAWTRDHVYPAADVTEIVAVRMDAGGQFFGQVAMGEHVAMGERVELVPRVLHRGGGMVQYFWKVRTCR